MSLRVLKTEEALRDLDDLAAYFASGGLDVVFRFLESAERTFEMLAEHPTFGEVYATKMIELAGLRVWPIRNFRKYLVFYHQVPDGIEVVRVMHGARDWRQT